MHSLRKLLDASCCKSSPPANEHHETHQMTHQTSFWFRAHAMHRYKMRHPLYLKAYWRFPLVATSCAILPASCIKYRTRFRRHMQGRYLKTKPVRRVPSVSPSSQTPNRLRGLLLSQFLPPSVFFSKTRKRCGSRRPHKNNKKQQQSGVEKSEVITRKSTIVSPKSALPFVRLYRANLETLQLHSERPMPWGTQERTMSCKGRTPMEESFQPSSSYCYRIVSESERPKANMTHTNTPMNHATKTRKLSTTTGKHGAKKRTQDPGRYCSTNRKSGPPSKNILEKTRQQSLNRPDSPQANR